MALPSQNSQRWFRQSFPNELQLFPYFAEDVISEVIPGDSPVMAWLPKEAVNTWNIDVHHLVGVWGEDFDGSQTYMEWVTDDFEIETNPAECDYGDGAMQWATFSYKYELSRVSVSNKSNPLNVFDKGGMMQYKGQTNMPRIRGEFVGQPVTNEAELALAMNGKLYYDHVHRTLFEGNSAVPSKFGMFDGLNIVNSVGWVGNHVIGPNPPQFSDPRVINGVGITTEVALIRRIEFEFFRTYNRLADRGSRPMGDDIVVTMPEPIWRKLAWAIATGALNHFVNLGNLTINTNLSDIQAVYEQITSYNDNFAADSNVQFAGFIPLNGYNLPVLVDNTNAANTTLGNGNPAVTGDVQVLCKRAFGQNILTLYYLNWLNVPGARETQGGVTPMITENGLLRIKQNFTTVTQECWYWSMDSYLGLGSRFAPAQVVIHDVTFEMDFENELEDGSWTHPNYYMYEGQTGGAGNSLLVATNT